MNKVVHIHHFVTPLKIKMYIHGNSEQAKQSRDLITNAFLKLTEQETFDEITITQICQYAEVARPTFYRNFESKAAVLEQYLFKISTDLISLNEYSKSDPYEIIYDYYTVVLNYKPILKYVESNGLSYLMKKTIRKALGQFHFSLQIENSELPQEYYDFLTDYVSSTICSVLEQWVKHDFIESVDELTKLTTLFLSKVQKR